MSDSVLNLILRASKTGSGVADAKRELAELNRSLDQDQAAAVRSAIAHNTLALSLTKNSSLANVTKQSQIGLREELNAGRISTETYTRASEASLLQARLVSPSALQAATSLNRLNAEYTKTGDVQAYTSGLKQVQAELAASERGAQALQVALGLAKVAAMAFAVGLLESVKAAADFESAMNRIEALTDTSKAEIGGMTEAVVEMGVRTGKAPQELANGLYFIASSGYAGAKGLTILNAAAKASAAGLGQTKIVADALTSAMNAYQEPVERAGHYTDILIQIVKEGKGEPEAFAGALGRVLPIASALGVSFEQVGASMATMTRIGLSADEAATALRGVLNSLLNPSRQATETLHSLGLSTDEVRNSIRDKGLLTTLKDLMERTQGNIETLGDIVPNVRALTGVLATAGTQGEAYAQVLDSMNHAAGATDKAFTTVSDTFNFKLKKTEASFDAVKIALGDRLLPVLGDFFNTLTTGLGTLDLLFTWNNRLTSAFQGNAQQILKTSKSYDEYANGIVSTGVAAGQFNEITDATTKKQLELDGSLDKVTAGYSVVYRKIGDHIVILNDASKQTDLYTRAQYEAMQGAYGLGGALDETNRIAQQQARAIAGTVNEYDSMTVALKANAAAQQAQGAIFATAYDIAIAYTDQASKMATEQKKLADIEATIAAAGSAQIGIAQNKKFTTEGRALAEAKLAQALEDLTTTERKKGDTDADYAVKVADARNKVASLTAALGSHAAALGGATVKQLEQRQAILDTIEAMKAADVQAAGSKAYDIVQKQFADGAISAADFESRMSNINYTFGLFDQSQLTAAIHTAEFQKVLADPNSSGKDFQLALWGIRDATLGADGALSTVATVTLPHVNAGMQDVDASMNHTGQATAPVLATAIGEALGRVQTHIDNTTGLMGNLGLKIQETGETDSSGERGGRGGKGGGGPVAGLISIDSHATTTMGKVVLLTTKLSELPNIERTIHYAVHVDPTPNGGVDPTATPHQFGGVAEAYRPSLVGEGGPELIFPSQRGFVMTNSDSMRLIQAMEKLALGGGQSSSTQNSFGGDTIVINDRLALAQVYEQKRRRLIDYSNARMGG